MCFQGAWKLLVLPSQRVHPSRNFRYLCRFLIAILRYQGNLISSYHIFVLSVCPTRVLDIDWLHIAPMMKPEEDDASFGNEPKKSSVDATFIATMST
ncbi:uncharacterized protein LOC114872407 isoform X3 [Osmia bicornis bicornis]|uniref:uncharacterized protein LOC114872407 isoform X3 n=1 Tax=Osmia bicornis bicornis TaxID=1437191 RepID=UPI001EAF3D8F|nr:uncharacterized protein LOC114872407 isoform X3 [Osmia bicornis bicornis]XP_046143711.1 uncharacterized protein LOC114872407 isoform X3 [Osmia bicornis bicornis]XP_046143712.1 uncharacterized protein LOC114872407 isoform X3 [Osmia bicornis bicornis]